MPVVAMSKPKPAALDDEAIVRLALGVLNDPRAWAVAGRVDLDPATLRAVRQRASALLREALETV